jgi:VCBS repeat-containing protein
MKQFIARFVIATVLSLSFNFPLQAGIVDSELETQLKTIAPNQLVSIIVTLKTRADTNAFKYKDKAQRRTKIVQAMHDHANLKQPALLAFLKANGATNIKQLWIINSVAAKVPASMIRKLAKRPGVAKVYADATLSVPVSGATSLAIPEWNLSAVHAPEVWDLGQTAQSVVVANMDTGVDLVHPDLATKWRGGTNSWYDPHGQYTTPTDNASAMSGHGTQTMGLILGGDTGGTTIGVAPGAKWIAAKIFNNQGTALESHFHQSFQWLLDPDNNPLTDDAPDVVNGSFQTAQPGICDTRFQADIHALKTAGIAIVFAAGNSGPANSSSSSPANNPGSFAAGAVDYFSTIATFSARGPTPVACGGSLFPNIVAPGVDIVTSDLTFAGSATYAVVSGTSFAAPHVAGSMALLIGAFPNVDVTTLESALVDSATDLGALGPDNEYGYGMLNVLGAYNLLANSGQNPVGVDDSYILEEDATLSVPAPGVLGNDTDPQNNPITAILDTDVGHGMLALNADGSFSYTPTSNYSGTDSFSYRVSDGFHESGVVTVVMTINPINDAPVAANDGPYMVISGQVLNVSASSGVLSNDLDVENNTLNADLGLAPPAGILALNADGSFSFNSTGVATGIYTFTYLANDGMATNMATATINVMPIPVNTAPIAKSDTFLYRPNIERSVDAVGSLGSGVLMNDSDAENNLLSAQYVVNSLSGGGTLNLSTDGSFTYIRATSANASFRYRANDAFLLSLPATGTTVKLRTDAIPTTVVDDCIYDISDNGATAPDRCEVLSNKTVKMAVALNDTDPNTVTNIPTDGVGSSIVASSTIITSVGTGVNIPANAACGQPALGIPPAVKGTIANNCDGTITVNVASGNNLKAISYQYRVSDDLGAQSNTRWVKLSVQP